MQIGYLLRLSGLCALSFSALATGAFSQEPEPGAKPLSISIGTVRTELEAAALRILVDYAADLNDLYTDGAAKTKDSWLFAATPSIRMEAGEKDAFNGLTAKLTGN
jgi:hypothetical protein